MSDHKQFAFDLEGPLDLYGCGFCGSAEVESFGAADLRCRDCLEMTSPELWHEWCAERGIDVELGPFLQAVKNLKTRALLPFDSERAMARYVGEKKAHVRRDVLARHPALRDEYSKLRSRHFRVLTIEEL